MSSLRIKLTHVKVGDRHRKDMGDLHGLADSISEVGLLQPIGVTKKSELVFGHRRLQAAKILGWSEIPCVVVDLKSIVAGEYAENEIRKAFTVSERVAIAKAVEEEEKPKAKERQVDGGKTAGRGRPQAEKVPEKSPEPMTPPRESRDVAAKKSGLGSDHTYRQAAKVVDKGSKDLVDAMDKGDVSINAAAKLADLPKPKQREVIKAKQAGDKQAVKKALAGPRPTYPLSDGFTKVLNDIVAALNLIRIDHGTITKMFEDPKWDKDETSYVVQQVNSLAKTFADMKKELNGREH